MRNVCALGAKSISPLQKQQNIYEIATNVGSDLHTPKVTQNVLIVIWQLWNANDIGALSLVAQENRELACSLIHA
jgi:hypothetical protein